ncbi:MAG: glutamyl-tRNA reductase [Planctomycetota bacterium]
MRLLMLGFNHRTAPLELREALAFDPDQATSAIRKLREAYPASECALISTCNRMELYLARPIHDPPTIEDLRHFIIQQTGADADAVHTASIHREQDEVATHLFRVSSGLDSMVLGEPQVLGQVKRAYELADRCGAVGPILHRLFQGAITASKSVRRETGIDRGQTSVSSVAVSFAKNIFDHFNDKTVLAIGAGEMVKSALASLRRENPKRLLLINRTHQRAIDLAHQLDLNGSDHGARAWDDMDALLIESDIVVSCTGSTEPILNERRFRPLLKKRRGRPLFMLDLAVPRDLDPKIGSLRNVYLYNLDDLQRTVQATESGRRELIQQAESLLKTHIERCMGEIRHRDVGRLVKQLRQRLHDIAEQEQGRTAKKLASLNGQSTEQAVEDLLAQHNHRLVNKILHLPLSQLDRSDPDAALGFYAAALRRLFDLQDQPEMPPEGPAETPEDSPSEGGNQGRRA